MAKKTYDEWMAERAVERQSVKGLKGINTIKPDLTSTDIKKLSQIPGVLSPVIQPAGDVYTKGLTPSTYDTGLGIGMLDTDVVLQNRAEQQSGVLKAFNAVVSGIGSGLLTAVETAGYLTDVNNNVNQLVSAEYAEDNVVSAAAKQAKKSLYEAMPIYEDVQSDGVLDQFTRFSTLRGMLDSAIGFAIPGGIVGKGVGVVGRVATRQILRSKRLASWVTGVLNQGDNTIAKALLKGTNPEKIREGVQSLVGGLITNYGEGKMMALELGEELENQYINVHSQKILAERYNNDPRFAQEAVEDARAQFEVDEDAKREIGKQQNNFMQNNTIFAITDAIGLHKLGLSTRSTREVVKQLTMNPLKNLGGVGGLMVQNTKESIEEIGQNVFQMEAGFQARKGMGIGSEEDTALTGKSLGDRYLSYATSDKALLEGMMGFVSGGLQRQLTQGFYDVASGDPLGKKRREAHNKRYEVQQALMAQYTEEKLKDMATADSFRAEFLQNNQESLANLINETEFTKMAREAAEGGTVGRLETLIKDIINLPPDKAEEQGYSKNYKEQYQQRLKELSDVEAIYMQHDGFKARDILASNRVTHKILTNSKQRYEDTLVNGYTREDARKESSQLEQLNKVLEVSNITPEFENGQRLYTVTLDNFAALKDTKNAADIIILPEYKNAFASFEALVKINEAIVDNNKKYQYIINEVEPNFEEVVEAQTEAAEKLAGTINKKQTTDAEISLRQDLEKAATQEERDAVFAAFKKRYEDSSIATSIQEIVDKVAKEYAPVETETTTTSSPESGTFIKTTSYPEFQKEFEQFLDSEFKEEALLSAESVLDDSGNVTSESINKILNDEEGFLSNYKTENAKKAAQNFLNGLKKYKDSKTFQTNSATVTTSPTSTETLPGNDKSFEGDNKVYVSNSSNDPVINAEMQVVENDIFTANEIQSGLNQSDALENLGKKDKYDYETKRINAWRHIAYLFRNYITKVVDKKVVFKDAENVANRPELIRALNKIKAGDEIEFRVIDNPDQEVYETDTDGKRFKTTWGQHEVKLSKDNISLFIPIEIYSNGELIGYMPAFDHLSSLRDLDFGTARQELAKMRNLIYAKYASGDKTPITSKITGVSAGHLIKAVNNELIPTNAALASDEVKIAIVKNKRLITMGGGSLTGTVLNNADNLKEGFTYAIVPLPNGKVAIPLQRNNLQKDQVVNMETALSIFMKVFNKETLTETERSTIAYIQDDLKSITRVTSANEVERVNFNITTVEGIRNYLSLYTHIHRAAGPSFDLLGQLAGRSFDTKFKAISIEEFVEKQSSVTENMLTGRRFIKITLANSNEVAEAYKYFPAIDGKPAHLDIIKSKGHGSSRVNSRQSISGADASAEFLNMASKAAVHFNQMTFTPSITLLENAASFKLRNLTNPHEVNSVVYSDYVKQNTSTNILGLNVGTEENPEYVYTQQRNYTFDNSFAEMPIVQSTETVTNTIEVSTNEVTNQEGDLTKVQKYTMNRANKDLPLAPEISVDAINEKSFGGENVEDFLEPYGATKRIKLLEVRGENTNGELVGTIRVIGEGAVDEFEVVFNKSKLKQVNIKKATLDDLEVGEGITSSPLFDLSKTNAARGFVMDAQRLPGVLNGTDPGVVFASIEHAIQFHKAALFAMSMMEEAEQSLTEEQRTENMQLLFKIRNASSASIARSLSNQLHTSPKMIAYWNSISSSLVEEILFQYVSQNQEVAKALKALPESSIVHKQQNSKWSIELPKIIIAIKNKLSSNVSTQENELSINNGLFNDVVSFSIDSNGQTNVNLEDTEILQELFESQLGISIFNTNFIQISPARQALEISTMVELISKALLDSPNNKLTSKEWKAILDERIKTLNTTIRKQAEAVQSVATLNYIDAIVDPNARPYIEELVMKAFKERAGIKTAMEHNEALEGADEVIEGVEGYYEKSRYIDSYTFQIDHRLTMSTKLKLALSTIPSGQVGIGNIPLSYPFDEIYDRSMTILAGTEPSYDIMAAKLQAQAHVFPWINPLLNHLANQDESVRNGFVVVMHKHYVNMLFLAWKKQQDGFKMKVWRSNSNAIERTIQEQWFKGLTQNTELVMINQYGKYQFTEKATQIAKEMQGISIPIEKGSDLRQKEAMNSLLNRLGIYLSDLTMDEIISNGLYYNGSKHKYNSLFGVGGTIVTDLYGKILNAGLELDQEEDDINIFSGGYMKALIKLEAKYTKMNLSNSHRTGDKTVNSYADTKQAFDRMAALKSDRKLLTTLSKLPFSKRSRMLKVLAQYDARAGQFIYGEDGLLLLNNDANFNPAAAEAFDAMGLDYLSLDVIKEIASEYVAGLSLEELGDREHEGIKASFFFNNKTVKEDGSRRGKLFYLTMSNKTIMTAMETPLSKFVLDEDGNIPEGTIANMVETLVLPEVDRMLAFRKYTKDGSISGPLEHYDKGTQIFYMIPALNYIDELFEKVNDRRMLRKGRRMLLRKDRRMLRKGLDNLDNLLPLIQQTIEEFINKSIDDQIAHWQTIGFGYNNETKVFDFIDRDMVTYYQQSLPKKISATAIGETTTVSETESEDEYNQRLFRTMAFDYLGNYMYHNMNLFQLFAADPALYYTAKQSRLLAEQNYEEVVKAVFNNIGKRLAAESAPGLQGDFSSVGMNYTVAMAKDTKISSDILTVYQRMGLSDSEIKSYREITSTDGAEFTTLEEHLKIMFVFNKLTRSQFDLLMKKLNQQAEHPGDDKYDFSKKELDLILKGVNLIINKPVQVHNRLLPYGNNVDNTIESRLYIKSAATPLIPQLTRELQLDAIRVRMESRNNPGAKIDRLAFASAVKVGIPVGAVEIFDTNGNVIAENLSKLPLVTVNRNGFRIQQEIPFKEDHETINDGTQQRELLFAGLLHHKDLAKLNKEYLATYNSIFSRYHDELMKEVGYDKRTGRVNTKAVLDIVRKEAVSRNYSINNIIALGLDDQGKLKYPLWGLPADSSIESLLLSIVDNRVRKLKLPGISTILSPQEGYNKTNDRLKSWEDVSNTASIQDTLFTDDFTGTLLPMRPADPNNLNGEWLPAQILISSTLKTPFGKDVNVRDYAIEKDGKWFLDTNVIPKELLKGFAYRIPTSSQSSMGLVQIVGFLPESMKEMVVASRDFIAQMGYDFDVDKLYANLYQMAYNPLEKKFQRLEDFSDEAITNVASLEMNKMQFKSTEDISIDEVDLEDYVANDADKARSAIESRLKKRRNLARDFNKLLDIHIQVMAHPETNKLRVQTVSYGKLEALAEEFGKKKAGSVSFNPLSPLYQKTKYINATAGQQGVGVFSAALVFLASAQAANLGYIRNDELGVNQFTVTINKHNSTGDLSSPATLDGSTTRLSIMSRFQNASVDDESLQVLSAVNINSNTFNALTAGAMLGFTEEELITIINQPVIIEYVKRLKTRQGAFSDYEVDVEDSIDKEMIQELLTKRGITPERYKNDKKTTFEKAVYDYNMETLGSWGKVSIDSFKNLVGMERPEDSTEAANYDNAQYFALGTFQKLRDAGKDILKVQNAVNLSSKGIGKSFLESSKKYISIKNIAKYNPNVVNAEALIGDYQRDAEGNVISFIPNTIRGYVTKYVLEPALEIYKDTEGNPLFPYTKPAFINALDQVLAIQGKSDAMGQAYLKEAKQFFNGLKGYLYSTPEVLGISNPNAERRRLLIDKKYAGNEEKEAGYNLSGRKYSLAGLLDLLASKNHPVMTNNKFLRRLQYTINQEGLPSMITYKATVAQSMEELSIYNDFTRLLMADAPITIQEQGETFTISSRELAIDLIKYSYLTGGVQGPSEFIRYIPVQFLINAGVGTKLNSVNFGDSAVYGDPTSGYMLQYIQHFPSKVAATFPVKGAMSDETLQYLSATEEYYTDSDNYLTQFTPSVKLASHFRDELPPVMKMELGKGKYELFMYDAEFNTYQRIPTLKYKQISEYQGNNLGNTVAQSIFIHNQTANLKLTVKGTTKSGKGINKNSNLSEREAYLQKYFPENTGYTLSALHSMLNDMLPGGAAENAELRPIVKRLIDAMDKYGINPKISILSEQDMPKHPSGASVRGAFLPDGTIVIRKSLPTVSEMRPAAYFTTTLVHEATHALLQHFVTDYVNNRPVPKDIAVALGKLEAMRNFSNIKAKLEEITDNEINHGVGTLNEFVAAITSSLQFREFIADSSNKKRLIDILLEIFSAIFGIQLNSNQDTLKFIDENVMAILDNLAIGGQTDVLTKGQTQVILGSVNRLEKYLSKNPSIEDASAYIQNFRMGLPVMEPGSMEYRNTLEDIAVLENYIENYANPVTVFSQAPLTTSSKISFQESTSADYGDRTRENAKADATLALAADFDSLGEKLTRRSVEKLNKKYIGIPVPSKAKSNNLKVDQKAVDFVVNELNAVNAKTLNIAGNGLYTMKDLGYTQEDLDNMVYSLLKAVVESPKLKTKIESVRTGGQTGFDEAGAKAAIKLGIPTNILAPKGWKFRDINSKDISNEELFKARFETKPSLEDEMRGGQSVISFSLENAINEGKVVSLEDFNTEIQEQIRSMMEWQNKNC